MIYLDYAAATPMDPAVLSAMQPYFTELFYNPSATYLPAQNVHKDLQAARTDVAHWLGAKPSEVIFTAGGTEANNLAIRGVLDRFPGSRVVTTAIEHESILATVHAYGNVFEASVNADGIVDVDKLVALIADDTVLVSVMYANNEVGTIQPIRRISQALEVVRASRRAAGNKLPLYLHTDAAQAAPYLDLHVSRLGVDLLTINAGKMYGPKQVGVLFVGSHVQLKPQVFGGGQERGMRSGTENVAGAVGLAMAFGLVQERRHDESTRLQQLQTLCMQQIELKMPDAIINGSRKHRLPNNVHVTFPGSDNERLIFQLDNAGILCAAGSACSADSGEPSHVLTAMGISTADARASLRFTFGLHTSEHDIRTLVDTLTSIL